MSNWTKPLNDILPKETLLTASGLNKYLDDFPKITQYYNAAEDIFLKFYHLIPRADSIPFLAGKNIYLMTIISCLLYNVLYIALTRIEYSHNIFKKTFGKTAYPVFASTLFLMWLVKSYLIMQTIVLDYNSYTPTRPEAAITAGIIVMLVSLILFALTFKYTSTKKLLGGEVFDYSLSAPPRGGLSDYVDAPNYTASSFSILAYSLINKSTKGIYLSLIVCLIYCVSSRLEDQLSMKICDNIHKKKLSAADQTLKKTKKKAKAKDS